MASGHILKALKKQLRTCATVDELSAWQISKIKAIHSMTPLDRDKLRIAIAKMNNRLIKKLERIKP